MHMIICKTYSYSTYIKIVYAIIEQKPNRYFLVDLKGCRLSSLRKPIAAFFVRWF